MRAMLGTASDIVKVVSFDFDKIELRGKTSHPRGCTTTPHYETCLATRWLRRTSFCGEWRRSREGGWLHPSTLKETLGLFEGLIDGDATADASRRPPNKFGGRTRTHPYNDDARCAGENPLWRYYLRRCYHLGESGADCAKTPGSARRHRRRRTAASISGRRQARQLRPPAGPGQSPGRPPAVRAPLTHEGRVR